jgi:hypothetical protein
MDGWLRGFASISVVMTGDERKSIDMLLLMMMMMTMSLEKAMPSSSMPDIRSRGGVVNRLRNSRIRSKKRKGMEWNGGKKLTFLVLVPSSLFSWGQDTWSRSPREIKR